MAYTSIDDVTAGFRDLDADETARAESLINEAETMIAALGACSAPVETKVLVVSRMVRRALGSGVQVAPLGSTQGSMSAGGYSQSWTIGGGTSGELYLSRFERRILGLGNSIGSGSPLERLVHD